MKKAMTNMFNVYDNIHTPQVEKNVTIIEWFNLIKESPYSAIIESARPFQKEHRIYKNVKGSIPAITYNFTFHTKKANDNIIESTGLLYLDIDDYNYDINNLDTSKIFAYYKSFGGIGYSILVKVDNMTSANYESTYSFICDELGLKNFHDKGAKKKTQFNVLSYDPNIFINYESYSFVAVENYLNDSNPNPLVIKKEKEAYTNGMGSFNDSNVPKVRYSDIYDRVKVKGVYAFNPNGWEYVTCWIPIKKIKINRNNSLLSYCNNLVWLNPHLSKAGAESIMNNVNMIMCQSPVDKANIKRVVNSIFNQKKEGKLIPIYFNKKRKIVFAQDSKLTREEKLEICGSVMNGFKIDVSRNKIYLILEQWDFEANDKITIKSVAKYGKMNNKTIEKYWSEFKEYAKSLNDEFYKNRQLHKTGRNKGKGVEGNIKSMESANLFESKKLLDIKMDDSESFYVANFNEYSRAIKLLTTTSKIMFRIRIKQLINAGYDGIEIYEADGYRYTFNVYGSRGLIEFISLADGDEILLKVA